MLGADRRADLAADGALDREVLARCAVLVQHHDFWVGVILLHDQLQVMITLWKLVLKQIVVVVSAIQVLDGAACVLLVHSLVVVLVQLDLLLCQDAGVGDLQVECLLVALFEDASMFEVLRWVADHAEQVADSGFLVSVLVENTKSLS